MLFSEEKSRKIKSCDFSSLVKFDNKFCGKPVEHSAQFLQAVFATLLNYLLPQAAKASVKYAPLRGQEMMVAVREVWATCRGWWPPCGPDICLSWPVIDSLLRSLKAQEVAGIILEYMWHQFVQIYIGSPPALKMDDFALLLLFFGNM